MNQSKSQTKNIYNLSQQLFFCPNISGTMNPKRLPLIRPKIRNPLWRIFSEDVDIRAISCF